MTYKHIWLHSYCQLDYFEANKGDGGKGDTPSTGYGSKVLSQSEYQKKDVSDFLGVKIERDNAVITVNLHAGHRFNNKNSEISKFLSARLAKP